MNRPVRMAAPNEAAALLHSFTNHLLYSLAKDQYSATELDRYMSLALTVRDRPQIHSTQIARNRVNLPLHAPGRRRRFPPAASTERE